MRIALLNLPYDNNYGGNLQRYALMKMLQDMGHDVTHLNLRFSFHLPWYKMPFSYPKRIVKKYILKQDAIIDYEQHASHQYEKLCAVTEPFYQRYVSHTKPILNVNQLKRYRDFDAFVVGSDQVWRKKIAAKRLSCMFLDFLPERMNTKRIAYGVSLGSYDNELTHREIKKLSNFYKKFDAVSVREESALDLFKKYKWNNPQAVQVLDPTFLLCKDDYLALIDKANTVPSEGNMLCYILDESVEKYDLVAKKAKKLHLTPFEVGLKDGKTVSVEQWLRFFSDSEYIVTDSYHGMVFAIIFNKPFYLFKNEYRGNARFDSVLNTFKLTGEDNIYNWKAINQIIKEKKSESLDYLITSLNQKTK